MHPRYTASLATLDYRLVVFASLLLSLWLISIDPLVNRDAIIYLRAADAYLEQGFAASQQLFGRPLLSICFTVVHQITGLSLLSAGLLLNSLFYALFCTSFVLTVATLGGDRRVQLLAALVVLSHPILNDHRSSIVRDPAYWAFLLLAFRELLLYARDPRWATRLRWCAWITLASLFRFEGVFFALLAPLSLLTLKQMPQRVKHCCYLLLPLLITATASVLTLLVLLPERLHLPAIERYIRGLTNLPAEFAAAAHSAGQAMLNSSAGEDAGIALIAALLAILLLNILRAITWPYVAVLLWGYHEKLLTRLRPDDARLLVAQLLISLGYLAAFTAINRFMLERYANQLGIFALLYLPFILNALWQADGRRHWKKIIVAALMVFMCLDSLHNSKHEKRFIRDARDWLVQHTPQDAQLLSNDKYLAYFSARAFNWPAANGHHFALEGMLEDTALLQQQDYLAMRVSAAELSQWGRFLQQHELQEIAVFEGGRHGSIRIVATPQLALPNPAASIPAPTLHTRGMNPQRERQ